MAESRNKIKAIGAPFNIEHSSCSDLRPNKFDWTLQDSDTEVHIDRGLFIKPSNKNKNNRFGWICESRFIIPDVHDFLKNNHEVLFDKYYNKIFTCDSELLTLNSNFIFCQNGSNYPWIKKGIWSAYNKSKLCSMFCSPKLMTEGHVYRHQLARLALDSHFDVFGGAHGTKRTVKDPSRPWDTKFEGLVSYMFSIVIENGMYDSYYTEKLTDCFATGTIPVYLGTNKLPDIFDPEGIIRLEIGKEQEIFDQLNESTYINKKKHIENNLNALKKLNVADDDLYDGILKYAQAWN